MRGHVELDRVDGVWPHRVELAEPDLDPNVVIN